MGTTVALPDGTTVAATPLHEQHDDRPHPEFGLYADKRWSPPWDHRHIAWPDFGAPADDIDAIVKINEAFHRARNGQVVEVGCGAAIGRTGTILACMAILAGEEARHAVAWVRAHYLEAAVERPEQEEFIERFGEYARSKLGVRSNAERALEARYREILSRLRSDLRDLRVCVAGGDLAQLWVWAIPGRLAVTTRPLRDHPGIPKTGPLLPSAASDLVSVVDRFVARGFATVVTFNADDELPRYDSIGIHPKGLLGYYRDRGLVVARMPWLDPAHHAEAAANYEETKTQFQREALKEYESWAKPVLMHCSGASDRSPPIAAWIAANELGR